MEHKSLTFERNGVTFHIRGAATRGDQYEMHAAMAEGTEIRDGRVIKTSASRLYPWLIARFVTGWSETQETNGAKILEAIMAQPATPGEDLILVLGAFILNHTGMVLSEGQVALKND